MYINFKNKKDKKIPLAKFQLELIRHLIEKYGVPSNKTKPGRPSSRLTARHFAKLIPAVPEGKLIPKRQRFMCAKTQLGRRRRKDSRY